MKLTDTRQLDWGMAKRSAQAILKACEDAAYIAPEAIYAHHARIKDICAEMNLIAMALCITPPKAKP